MVKVAIVDKYNKGYDYKKIFGNIAYDNYHLATKNKKKLLKADIDIEIDPNYYDYIITVGAEATKFFSPKSSVTTHQGYLVNDKILPIIDPSMLTFKPDAKPALENAISNILEYINGTKIQPSFRDAIGVEDEDTAHIVLSSILAQSIRPVAIDTETGALYPRDGELLGVSIANETHKGYYISAEVFTEECTELLQQIVDKHTIVFHNAKFDMSFLNYHLGIDFKVTKVTEATNFEDTLLQHYMLDETTGTHGLKPLCIKYTDMGDYDLELDTFKREYCKKNGIKLGDFTYNLIPFEVMYPYAAKDAMGTLELYIKFSPLLNKNSKLKKAYDLVRKGTKLLVTIENNGVPFSKEALIEAQAQLTNEIFSLEEEIYKYKEVRLLEETLAVKFNPNSVVHLRYLFYSVLNLPIHGKKTATGENSVDAEVLDELANHHPIVEKIGAIKKARKIKSTYIDKVLVGLNKDERLRTGFNLTATTSGRLSSSGKLNMQQLPRDNKIVKACIKAPEGYVIVSQDLGTAEVYVAAVLSGDTNLMKVFIDRQKGNGADFHSTIAHMVFHLPCEPSEVKKKFPLLRQAAKAITFGILYGSGPQKVADTVNAEGDGSFTIQDANEAISSYFTRFPKLKKWLKDNEQKIKRDGFIYSIFGRKRRLANVFSSDRSVQGHEVRSGINFLVQSVASDINLMAAIDLQQYINDNSLDVELFGLVHDSILAVVNKNCLEEYLTTAKKLTQQDFGCSIPGCPISIDQEVGYDYAFKEKVTINGKTY